MMATERKKKAYARTPMLNNEQTYKKR